ncbi:hypothetical protein CMK18_24030 [Candidatus Poribacteria bacterium]|nr:hypothetical protein [Candidatus Poribacteria bacterium]|tara:strand:+ start:256 stop:636 length:381 start_codon:yes stop_codon:yes gene_type:complete
MATRKPIVYINGYPGELDIASDRLNTPWIYRSDIAPTAQEADIWYDTGVGILKMWNGSGWDNIDTKNAVYVQGTAPSSGMSQGDWWYNTTTTGFSMYLAGSINQWTTVTSGSGGGGGSISDILAYG